MKVFLDTNIILDVILQRDQVSYGAQILSQGEQKLVELYVSFLSIANVAYVIRKGRTPSQVRSIISGLYRFVDILPMNKQQVDLALQLDAKDFEDVLQYQCAIENGCDIIVTRNVRDYAFSQITVKTPAD